MTTTLELVFRTLCEHFVASARCLLGDLVISLLLLQSIEAYRDIQRTEAGLQKPAEAWSRPADTCRDLVQASKDLQIPVETKRRPAETWKDHEQASEIWT